VTTIGTATFSRPHNGQPSRWNRGQGSRSPPSLFRCPSECSVEQRSASAPRMTTDDHKQDTGTHVYGSNFFPTKRHHSYSSE
jgi:hypothetical protein